MQKAYRSKQYADCFLDLGESYRLANTDSYLIKKPFKDGYYDLYSPYPILDFHKKQAFSHIDLISDISSISDGNILAATIITNPLLKWEEIPVGDDPWCWSYCKKYKTHYYIDFKNDLDLPTNHKRNIKKALNKLEIRINLTKTPDQKAESFTSMYKNLVEKHSISGFADFSDDYFRQLFKVPGILLAEAFCKGSDEPCGQITYLLDGDYAYYHLAAYNSQGYANNASFGIMYSMINYFKELGISKLLLGSYPGNIETEDNGLLRFKRGFSNSSRQNFILGKILNKSKYNEFSQGKSGEFFPLYRS
jgi:hypothetical protein